MIVNQLSREERDMVGPHPGVEKTEHPLLQQCRLANLPAAANAVDPRLLSRKAVEQGVTVDVRKIPQTPQIRIAPAEERYGVVMEIIGNEDRIKLHRSAPLSYGSEHNLPAFRLLVNGQ